MTIVTTVWDTRMGKQAIDSIPHIAHALGRIADALEKQNEAIPVDPADLGALALWREDVAAGNTTIGFAAWMAWKQSDLKAELGRSNLP